MRAECVSQIRKQVGNVIVKRRHVQMPRRRELPYLYPPPGKQSTAVAANEFRQLVQDFDDILLASVTLGMAKLWLPKWSRVHSLEAELSNVAASSVSVKRIANSGFS